MPYTAPTTRAANDVVTHTIWNADVVENAKFFEKMAWGYLGETKNTSSAQTSISEPTIVDLTGASVTVTVGTNRRIKITAIVAFSNSTSDSGGTVYIREGTTTLGMRPYLSTLANRSVTGICIVTLSPTAGSHTYKIGMTSHWGGTVTVATSTENPLHILVEDIGGY